MKSLILLALALTTVYSFTCDGASSNKLVGSFDLCAVGFVCTAANTCTAQTAANTEPCETCATYTAGTSTTVCAWDTTGSAQACKNIADQCASCTAADMECVPASDFLTTKAVECLSKCRGDSGWDATKSGGAGCAGVTVCNGTSKKCECTAATANATSSVCNTGYTCTTGSPLTCNVNVCDPVCSDDKYCSVHGGDATKCMSRCTDTCATGKTCQESATTQGWACADPAPVCSPVCDTGKTCQNKADNSGTECVDDTTDPEDDDDDDDDDDEEEEEDGEDGDDDTETSNANLLQVVYVAAAIILAAF